ncbi:MAG: hypothetical protein ACRD1Z_13200 [Vicinamibacteria bacterium]
MKRVGGREYLRCLLLDVVETFFPVTANEREEWETLASGEEFRHVVDAERTWADRLMLTGFVEGKRQVLKRQLTTKFGPLPAAVERSITAIESEDELDRCLDCVLAASSLEDMGLKG